jgi:hypothetical protein
MRYERSRKIKVRGQSDRWYGEDPQEPKPRKMQKTEVNPTA